ncbi:MAG: bifunctional GTP diphosphokinase/guanosine-3',5'-bis pyrophosphate 3'-pyrophosphohydrolase [Gammaproteobacteria bacterium]|nr:bifunctional GTP diphosphokinase/guanosine-3',5'-bis pyrophosphate 3'-pyrophosphohydrolase [Gammaproteobacteria bacterium]
MGADTELDLFAPLRERLKTYLDDAQVAQVEAAFVLARDAHEGQNRSSGEPYITHPVAVASILAEIKMDAQSIMAALMHDVLEDTPIDRAQIAGKFGEPVADLVEGVSKLTQIKFRNKAEAQAENFRKMMMAMVEDIRVILIKLADRTHNMRTLGALRPDKRRRIALETLEIYAPIANRLGLYQIREELEDLGFAAMYPMRHRILKAAVEKARGNRKEIVQTIAEALEERLKQSQITAKVIGRKKHLYSIYEKMKKKHGAFNDVMDVYGFRIIVDSVDACYRVLGLTHNLYKPVPGRFKDYIAIPKTNGYQSLHTTLKGPYGLHIEIQIRTRDMEQLARNGVAAHWLYKQGGSNTAQVKAREWMRRLQDLQEAAGDSIEFVENVKIDLFPDEVYVFTPNGQILEMPAGATLVDFAYAIHTDVGNACIAGKVDRQLMPLSTPLHNGETVEIVTAPGARPNPAWLSFVTTGKARANIRNYLKNQKKEEASTLGKRLLEKELGKPIDSYAGEQLLKVLHTTKFKDWPELLADIGLGNTPALVVAHRLTAGLGHAPADDVTAAPIAIKGTEGMLVSFAKCCRPIPGDSVVGYLSAGKGIVVHVDDCKNLQELRNQQERFVPVQWEDTQGAEFAVELRVDVVNQRGVLAQLATAISGANANIINIDIDERDGSYYHISFLVGVSDRWHLAQVIKRLRALKVVNKILRNKH